MNKFLFPLKSSVFLRFQVEQKLINALKFTLYWNQSLATTPLSKAYGFHVAFLTTAFLPKDIWRKLDCYAELL